MSFNITVDGGTSVRLPTKGKYCDRDIVITAPGGGGDTSAEDGLIDRTITEYRNDRVTVVASHVFYNNNKLTTLDFPAVTTISTYAFYGCRKLEFVNIPNLKTFLAHAFDYCSSLKTVDFPLVDNVSDYAFRSCSSIETVNFPIVTKIGNNAFDGCNLLKSVDFPMVGNIGKYAFQNCETLESITLRKSDGICNLPYVNAFTGTPIEDGTGYIYVPADLVESYKAATNWSTYASQIVAIPE